LFFVQAARANKSNREEVFIARSLAENGEEKERVRRKTGGLA